jgi:hypothetical protein
MKIRFLYFVVFLFSNKVLIAQPEETRRLIDTIVHFGPDTNLRAAAKLAFQHIKQSGGLLTSPDFDNPIPGETEFVNSYKWLKFSIQREDLKLANHCAALMQVIKGGGWKMVPQTEGLTRVPEIPEIARTAAHPYIRLYMLISLAVDNHYLARRALVQATLDADPGIRKCACYLVEKCTGLYFGPIGNIQIASTEEEVNYAGKAIREKFEKDACFGILKTSP